MSWPLPQASADRPVEVVFLASGGPGNFAAALDLANRCPRLLSVRLLVTDRPGTASEDLARRHGIHVHQYDYEALRRVRLDRGGTPDQAVRMASADLNLRILDGILAFEKASGRNLDLAALAYRRILSGPLLDYFEGRAINQHPADLAVRDRGRRLYTGIGGHARALADGRGEARTSTILVRKGVDTGEILCRGPIVPFDGDPHDPATVRRHEEVQKARSDWPALKFSLAAIASGRLRLLTGRRHPDGCAVVAFDGTPLPYGGVDLEATSFEPIIADWT